MRPGRQGGLRLAVATLGLTFLVGSLTIDDFSQLATADFIGTVALSLPFVAVAAWAWSWGDRFWAVTMAASSVLPAVQWRSIEKGDLVPLPIEVGFAYLLYRLGRTVWKARQLET